MRHDIVITSGDPSTGKVTLNPSGTLRVRPKDKVYWSITAPNITEFYIKIKSSSQEIFSRWDPAPSRPVKEGKGTIKKKIKVYTEYEYTIHWYDSNIKEWREHDPKIAVDPTIIGFKVSKVTVISAVLGVLAIALFLSKRKDKAELQDGNNN